MIVNNFYNKSVDIRNLESYILTIKTSVVEVKNSIPPDLNEKW
jgi:hypothetical protein